MSYGDMTIICAECGRPFVFAAGEQAYYAQQGITGAPRRCPECRANVGKPGPVIRLAGTPQGAEAASGPPPSVGISARRFDKFTDRAKKVLVLAQEEALRFNHNYIGTEHLLLGLVREGEGVAAKVLSSLGVELEKVRSSVEFIIGRGAQPVKGDISLAPRVKKVIELAVSEAKRLGHSYVGTEHLLLGIVVEGEGIAAGVLESLGVDLQGVRAQVLQTISSPEARAGEPAPAARTNVLTCRVDDVDLAAIDTLLEAGVCTTRSEAASWLIHAGIQANRTVFEQVGGTVEAIRRLRGQAQTLAQQAMQAPPEPGPGDAPGGGDPASEEPPPESPGTGA